MRIAVDARPLTHPTTGIGRYTAALLRRICTRRNELLLYSHTALTPEWGQLAAVRHGNVSQPVLSTVFAQGRFGRWARQDRADVFWSPRHHLPAGLGRTASVVTIHDLVWRTHPETMIRLGRLVESWLMPRALATATRVIAVSHATADDVRRYYPASARKLTVIGEASDLPIVSRESAASPPYFLFVGTLEPRKNLARAIEAFVAATADGAPHRLLVAGNPGWKNLALTRALRDAPRVEWLGRLDDVALARLYAGAYGVLVPSLYEGFGLQIAEAMAAGVPVITSNTSSMPEVAGDAALLVDPYSVESITDAIRRMIRDPELHAALAARAATRGREFSWDRAAEATVRVLEEAAGA